MKKLFIAYLAGMFGSIPAYLIFNNVGASPFRDLDAVSGARAGSLSAVCTYFVLIWLVPAFTSALGAKIAGCPATLRACSTRGVGGRVLFSIGLSVLMMFVNSIGAAVGGLATSFQTIVFLLFAQLGCTLGTVWGL
jgi:hypothetical protein